MNQILGLYLYRHQNFLLLYDLPNSRLIVVDIHNTRNRFRNFTHYLKFSGFSFDSGVGWFHRWLFFVCGIAMLAVTIEILFVGYILPSAQCDLKLTTGDKGLLGAAGAVGLSVSVEHKQIDIGFGWYDKNWNFNFRNCQC